MFEYSLDLNAKLVSSLRTFQAQTFSSFLIISIENEELKNLCDPIPFSGPLSDNLCLLRFELRRYKAKAAYIVMRLPDGTLCLTIYIADGFHSCESIKYLFGVSNISKSLAPLEFFTIWVHNISEIQTSLFEDLKKKNYDDLPTESKRLVKDISAMEVKPPTSIFPVTILPFSKEAQDSLQKYAVGLVDTVAFMIKNSEIVVDRVLVNRIGDLSDLREIIPETDHRYVLTHYNPTDSNEKKSIMIYICPLSHNFKEGMLYASAATSFLSFVDQYGIRFHFRKEVSDFDELVSVLKESFSENAETAHQVGSV